MCTNCDFQKMVQSPREAKRLLLESPQPNPYNKYSRLPLEQKILVCSVEHLVSQWDYLALLECELHLNVLLGLYNYLMSFKLYNVNVFIAISLSRVFMFLSLQTKFFSYRDSKFELSHMLGQS